MEVESTLWDRIESVRHKATALDEGNYPEPLRTELKSSLARITQFIDTRRFNPDSDCDIFAGTGTEQMEVLRMLFHLDRCEQFLDRGGQPEKIRRQELDPEELLYPSIGVTILRRFLAGLLYVRGRWLRCSAKYDHPTLREIIYWKSPAWLVPCLRIILPNKRPDWSHQENAEKSSSDG